MGWGVFLKLQYFDKHDKQSSTTRKRKAPRPHTLNEKFNP